MTDSFLPFRFERKSSAEMREAGESFLKAIQQRRSIRDFSPDPVPKELIATAIEAAGTAPSGAHQQPWKFVAISNPQIKQQIRVAAEREEYESYEGGRMSDEWRAALRPLGTSWEKPFLEIVPWIVVVFEETHGWSDDQTPIKHYYVKESVGIACGLFITALHQMGLATLTHTPSPMAFLSDILKRPQNERPYILFPIGYPADGATVPDLHRKAIDEISEWYE